jgi:hypothetical protein
MLVPVHTLLSVGTVWLATQLVENTSVGGEAREGAGASKRAASPAEEEAEISRVRFAIGPGKVLEYL